MRQIYIGAAAALALAACTSEPILLENTGRTVQLAGGPPRSHTTLQGIEWNQPEADRLCRQNGYSRAQSAGQESAAFIATYIYSCVND